MNRLAEPDILINVRNSHNKAVVDIQNACVYWCNFIYAKLQFSCYSEEDGHSDYVVKPSEFRDFQWHEVDHFDIEGGAMMVEMRDYETPVWKGKQKMFTLHLMKQFPYRCTERQLKRCSEAMTRLDEPP
jgi:hypothetical protein